MTETKPIYLIFHDGPKDGENVMWRLDNIPNEHKGYSLEEKKETVATINYHYRYEDNQ